MSEPSTTTVLVTGASGFIAQHCILELLRAGYRVRGTVRDLDKVARVRQALSAHVDVEGRLEFVQADLSSDSGWAEAARGCRYVMHVASPLPRKPPKHEDDLIVPARDGALRVLRAASEARVERVVMTSSLAAVLYGHARDGSQVYDEESWSILGDKVGAYEKSKTIAERAAWDFVEQLPAERRIELVAVNPGLVMGPILDDDYGTSGELVKKLLGREVPGCVRVGWAVVDVRDVAQMHLLAMTKKEAAGQRFVCAGEFAWMIDVAKVLDRHFRSKGYKVPLRELPGWALRIVALFDKTMSLVIHEIDQRQDVSYARAANVLGWKPRGLEEMTVAMGESLIRYGIV